MTGTERNCKRPWEERQRRIRYMQPADVRVSGKPVDEGTAQMLLKHDVLVYKGEPVTGTVVPLERIRPQMRGH